MNVERYDDASRFLAEAGAFLAADEPRHNLILGIAGTMTTTPGLYPDARFWVVRDGDEVAAAALHTPPYNLALAQPRNVDALAALADDIDSALPGVTGAVPEVDAFVELWASRHDVTTRVVFEQGVFALRELVPQRRAAGRMRTATDDDFELVLEWFSAFAREALHGAEAVVADQVRARYAAPSAGFGLWEDDGEIVSFCGFSGPTPNGIRIGPVYTPPELRGRGYGTTLTADVSAKLLASGRTFCFLYTDLANPTSNAIYERIGYARVCDSRQIAFE